MSEAVKDAANLDDRLKACQRDLAQTESEFGLIVLWDSHQEQCEAARSLKNETAAKLEETALQYESAAQAADAARQAFDEHRSMMWQA